MEDERVVLIQPEGKYPERPLFTDQLLRHELRDRLLFRSEASRRHGR